MKQYTTHFRDGKKETELRELREEPKETGREKNLVNLYPQVGTIPSGAPRWTAVIFPAECMPRTIRREMRDLRIST